MTAPNKITDAILEAEKINEHGVELAEKGKYAEAEICFERALELDPEFKEVWFNIGELNRKQGDFGEAVKCFKEATAIDPNFEDAWISKGFAHSDKGEEDEALKCYEKALSILRKIKARPKTANDFYRQGILYLRTNRFADAIAEFDKAIKIHPNFAEAWFAKSRAYFAQHMKDETLKCIKKAMDLFIRQKDQDSLDEVEKWVRKIKK